jgi:hypothetical protein
MIRNLSFSNRTGLFLQSGIHLTHFAPSSPAQSDVSVVIQTSLELTVTVTCDPELDFLKQNWVMSAEWSTLDSLFHSTLAQRYVSGVIQTFRKLTFTVTCDSEHDFLKQKWVMSAKWSTRDSIPHSSLAQR